MLEALREFVRNKRVLIWGFGREGRSTYRLLTEGAAYAALAVCDLRDCGGELAPGVRFIPEHAFAAAAEEYDVIFKSPGIVPGALTPKVMAAMTSQTEVFLRLCRDQVVGITGTKGKSTTATLLHHILSKHGSDCVLVGNIGVPAFDRLERIGKKTVVVFELSCHQLEYTRVSPRVGVLLNIFEEHLDHYGSMEKYRRAKENIYRFQREGDVLICHSKERPADGAHPGVVYTAAAEEGADITARGRTLSFRGEALTLAPDATALFGAHNLYNIAVVRAVCRLLDVSDEAFLSGLKDYTPLPHRLEHIGVVDGVSYYDDSISTACETTIQALRSVPDVGSVIIGGMDRGIDYSPLTDFLLSGAVAHVILMYETGRLLYPRLKGKGIKAWLAGDLREAVSVAKRVTPKGKSCVLSPAAASYGDFKNFEERGDLFRQYVMAPRN